MTVIWLKFNYRSIYYFLFIDIKGGESVSAGFDFWPFLRQTFWTCWWRVNLPSTLSGKTSSRANSKKNSSFFPGEIFTLIKISLLSPIDSNVIHSKTALKALLLNNVFLNNLNLPILWYVLLEFMRYYQVQSISKKLVLLFYLHTRQAEAGRLQSQKCYFTRTAILIWYQKKTTVSFLVTWYF